MAKRGKNLFATSGQYGLKPSGRWGKLNEYEHKMRDREPANPDELDEKALRDMLRPIARRVNRNAKALRDYERATGHRSPALDDLENSGGNISIRGTRQDLMNELIRAQIFENDPTHTVSGTKKFFGNIATKEDFWYVYKKLRQIDSRIATAKGYSKTRQMYDEYQVQMKYTKDEILQFMINRIGEITEETRERYKNMRGVNW